MNSVKSLPAVPCARRSANARVGALAERVRGSLRLAGLAMLVGACSPNDAWAQTRQVVPGHVPTAVVGLQSVGRVPPDRQLAITIGLPAREPESLLGLLRDLYDPASPNFRKYLSPSRYAELFAPSEADYRNVLRFAEAHRLAVAQTFADRTMVRVTGAARDVEEALHVKLMLHVDPRQGRTFFAPDGEPSLDLETRVLHITGLDDFRPPQSHPILRTSATAAPARATPAVGSGIWGTYGAADLRAAYAPGVTLTGAGQVVGIFNPPHGLDPADVMAYQKNAGITPPVPVETIVASGAPASPDGYSIEVTLDVEMAVAMAPGLAKVIVYQGDDDLAVLKRMATDNVAKQLSTSWIAPPQDANADQIYTQFALQGQTFFAAAGDDGAYYPTVPQSAQDPHVTVVGGTVLTTSGPAGHWTSETVWQAGGGGSTGLFPMPDWQQGLVTSANHGLSGKRNSPDVSMVAQDLAILYDGGPGAVSGTSAASPLWAAFTALINQRAEQIGLPPVGFLNPSLYAVGRAPGTAELFHDIQAGDNRTPWNTQPDHDQQFFAQAGFDMASGWGSPGGPQLIELLATSGALQSRPALRTIAAAANLDGAIELFGLSGAGSVEHARQVVPGLTWGPWSSIGGHGLQQVIPARNADGRLEVFGLGQDGVAYHAWQSKAGGMFGPWQSLAGHDLAQVEVAMDSGGRLLLLALGADGTVYARSQNVPNGGWTDWTTLHGSELRRLAVGNNADGRIEAFAIGKDGALHHAWQMVNGGWSGWESLAGHDLQELHVAANADGRLEAFTLGGNGTIYHIRQTSKNGNWGTWSTLAGHDIRELTVGANADGRLELFARGADGAAYHRWQISPNAGWSAWAGLAGHDLRALSVNRNVDGRLELFALGADQAAYDRWQTTVGGDWGAWAAIR